MGETVFGVFGGFAIGMLCVLWPHVAALRKRVTRIEGKLDLLLKQAELQYDPFADIPAEVAEAVRSGDKVLAIKRYREATGTELRDAKEVIEDLQRLTGVVASPDATKAGCLIIFAMVVCSGLGATIPLLIWRPDPGSYIMFLAAAPGGIAGAFIGLFLGIIVYRAVRKRGSETA